MRAILVTCPHCGARLTAPEASSEVRCAYCDTVARIQRRTGVLARPAPLGATERALPIAVERRGARVVGILAGVVLMLVGGLAVGFLVQTERRPSTSALVASPTPAPPPAEPPSWQGTYPPILVDLTGDGVIDVVGRSRRVGREDVTRVMVLDGATGQLRWEGPSLGTYIDSYQGLLAVAGELILFASPRGEVSAIAAATGEPRWTTRLDERTERFCDGGDTVIAVGVDAVQRPLRRSDGAAIPATGKPTACRVIPGDHDRVGGTPVDWAVGERHGMLSAVVASGRAGRVLAGMRRTGTQVPMLAALEGKKAERWKIIVPVDPLAASQRTPGNVVVGEGEVCASYETEGSTTSGAHLACFAMADGRRIWDIALRSAPSSVQLAGRALVVARGGVQLLDLDTGAVRWTY
jgi:LSD1 subclass zinc finger protein